MLFATPRLPRARTPSAQRAEHRRAAVFFIQLDAQVRGELPGKNGDSSRQSSVISRQEALTGIRWERSVIGAE
jgi:hypothetical protein